MKTNRFLTMLCAAILMSAFNFGCKEPEIERMASSYFIPYGITADTLYKHSVTLSFESDKLKRFSATDGNSDDKERYKQYMYYFGDFGEREDHNGAWFGDSDNDPEFGWVCVCDIKSIDVVCNQYFNQLHSANQSVNDIITIIPWSGYTYLHNFAEQYKQFDLQNVDKDYFKLNGTQFAVLFFNQMPDKAGEYEFTITVTMDADPVSGDTPTIAPIKTTIKFEQ